MFMRVYCSAGLIVIMTVMFWLGFHFLMTGFGRPFGVGVCTGIGLMLSFMYFGGLWSERNQRRAERREELSALRRIE